MKINGIPVKGDKFAYDGCHKIYVIEDKADEVEARHLQYDIYPIVNLKDAYENSCELRFISNWKLDLYYTRQFEDATFED